MTWLAARIFILGRRIVQRQGCVPDSLRITRGKAALRACSAGPARGLTSQSGEARLAQSHHARLIEQRNGFLQNGAVLQE